MKQRIAEIVVLLVICAVAGVWLRGPGQGGTSTRHSLDGRWTVDLDRQFANPNLPEREKFREGFSHFAFDVSGSTMTVSGPQRATIDLEITAQQGDTWTVETHDKIGKTVAVTLVWTDDNHIVGNPNDRNAFYLVRTPSAPKSSATATTP